MRTVFIYYITIKQILRGIPGLNLGDHVIYKGEKYILVQGVSDPYWDIHKVSDNSRLEYVHSKDFKKCITLRNLLHDITFIWRFYSSNWHSIWFTSTIDEIKNSPIRGFKP